MEGVLCGLKPAAFVEAAHFNAQSRPTGLRGAWRAVAVIWERPEEAIA